MRKIFTLLFVVLTGLQLRAQTVYDVIADSEDHTILEAAIQAAGLEAVLTGAGPFTVFAPTDAAFEALPEGTLDALLADPSGDLMDILLYHVVGETIFAGDLADGAIVTTLEGSTVLISVNEMGEFVNEAMITVADLDSENGIVHVIDAVLLPPPGMEFSLYDAIESNPGLNTLQAAVDAAGLEETLRFGGPYTVFAPTNEAFDLLPEGMLEAWLENPTGFLTEVLFNHIVDGITESSALTEGEVLVSIYGEDLVITVSGQNIFVNGAQVVMVDIQTDNGVLHMIDAVLVPGEEELPTIYDIVVDSENHTILEQAVIEAGFDLDLSEAGPITLFAPTDDAFNALPEGTLEALLADPSGVLTELLLYHITDGIQMEADLTDGLELTTLQGETVTITIDENVVFVNNAAIVVSDIMAANGVVHVIDAVLLLEIPEPVTVWDIIQDSPDHTVLETAIGIAGLDNTLSNVNGTFTVFAPTDAAFAALPAGTIEALVGDPTGLLTQVLTYHLVGSAVFSTDLADGQTITTVQGESVTVTINGEGIFINDAEITVADIETDNGVVHVIDAVLLPASGVGENTVSSTLQVYPNPANTTLNVYFEGKDRAMYEVVSMTGARVMEGMLNEWNNMLDVSGLENGLYTIRILEGNTFTNTTFIKN